jgi:2,3-bisphosphoglycerate-independent phosphoglycerate mutase
VGPVPLVYLGDRSVDAAPDGALRDVAPTCCDLLGLPQPADMLGHNLVHFDNDANPR